MHDPKNYEVISTQRANSLLGDMVGKEGNSDPNRLFFGMWKELFADREMMIALSMMKDDLFHSLQLNLNERLHLMIMMTLQRARIGYCPSMQIQGDQHIKAAIAAKTSSMFVGVHDGFAFMSRVLFHYGQKASIITSDPYIGNTLWRTGLRPDQVELITNDFRCLERLRKSMERGVIPANCIDYRSENGVLQIVSPAIFNFAIRRNYSIFFVKRRVGDDGVVYIQTGALKTTLDPTADAQAFIDFERSDSYSPNRSYTVKQ